MYRLKSATGRETDLPRDPAPWAAGPRSVDITRTRAYTENYTYNAAGTLLRLSHSSAGGFTRDFVITTPSNRVHRMQDGTTPYDYTYDTNGNLLTETTSRHFTWNHLDQLTTFATQTAGAEPSVHAHYLYDASGERVKKLVRRQGGAVEVTHYLGGLEQHRWGNETGAQNNHIHVTDDQERIALVRIGPAGPGDQSPAVAFQLADHLGSATVTVDDTGTVVNREEYTAYGETSFGSYARKRYRFTGKERDEESGLNYHSARYYLPWLARWASCDPLRDQYPSVSAFCYALNNPLALVDPSGKAPGDAETRVVLDHNYDEIDKLRAEFDELAKTLTGIQKKLDVAMDRAGEATQERWNRIQAGWKSRTWKHLDKIIDAEKLLREQRDSAIHKLYNKTSEIIGAIDYLESRDRGARWRKFEDRVYGEHLETKSGSIRSGLDERVSRAKSLLGGLPKSSQPWSEVPLPASPVIPQAVARYVDRSGGGGGGGNGPKLLGPGGGMVKGGVMGVLGALAMGMATGDTPDAEELTGAFVSSLHPALAPITARDEGEAGFAILVASACAKAGLACAYGAGAVAGGAAIHRGYKKAESWVGNHGLRGISRIYGYGSF